LTISPLFSSALSAQETFSHGDLLAPTVSSRSGAD
jgi:hypothetical protein